MQLALALLMLCKAGSKDDVQGVIKARDEYWRRARQTLTPTFSAHKMKLVRVIDTGYDRKSTSVSDACVMPLSGFPLLRWSP